MKVISSCLLILCFFSIAFPQPRQSPLRKVNRQITLAKYLLDSFPDEEAGDWIRQAELCRDQANQLLATRRLQRARNMFARADNLSRQAVEKLSRMQFKKLYNETNALIEHAEPLVRNQQNDEARRLLAQAKNNSRLSRELIEQQNFRKAFEFLRTAKFQIERCLRLVKKNPTNIDKQIEIEQNKFDNLLNKTKDLVIACESDQAQKLYNQVKGQLGEIDQALAHNQKELALNLYHNSTRLLLRVLDVCSGYELSPREQAQEEIDMLVDLLETVSEIDIIRSNSKQHDLLFQAQQLLEKAQNSYSDGLYEKSQGYTTQARNMLSTIWSIGDEFRNVRIEQEIKRLDKNINRAKRTSVYNTKRGSALVNAAQMCLEDASNFLQNLQTNLALQSLLAGNRFIAALDIPEENFDQQRDKVEKKIKSLENQIEQSFQTDESKTVVDAVSKILSRAKVAFSESNYELALEYATLGLDLLNKIN